MNKIQVTKSSMPEFDEYVNEIKDIWDSRWLTNSGPKHNLLEKKLQDYLDVNSISLFSNGHLALYTAIKALKLSGSVITTPYTFASTTHAIVQNGLRPIFCDIKLDDYTIDASKIESLIEPDTTAIIGVHVYGNPCEIAKIENIAKKHNLKVIYDAAHSFGVEINGHGVASYGDISMFSFHATKVFHTIEGGCLAYNNDKYKSYINQFKNFGIVDAEHVVDVGINSKMNEFQAAMGLCNLKHIDENIKKRKDIAERYRKNLKCIKEIKICTEIDNVKYNYIYFPILIDSETISRDDIYQALLEQNIYSRKYFYPLITDFDCYKGMFDSNIPNAKFVAQRILTLPMYSDLNFDDVDRICNIVKGVFNK